MAKNNRYTLKYRRRREGKTNYHRRLKLLKSRKTRLVIRKTNNNTTAQFINYEPDGDVVVASSSTQNLSKGGWKHGTSNIPAAYLTGYEAGAAALKKGVKEAIVDIGMQKPMHGGRLFAAVRGAVDAGVNIHVSESAFPAEERLRGNHINEKVGKDIDKIRGIKK